MRRRIPHRPQPHRNPAATTCAGRVHLFDAACTDGAFPRLAARLLTAELPGTGLDANMAFATCKPMCTSNDDDADGVVDAGAVILEVARGEHVSALRVA